MTVHHTFYKGKRVLVVLRNGTKFIDRFVARHSNSLEFELYGKILLKDIRSTTIASPKLK